MFSWTPPVAVSPRTDGANATNYLWGVRMYSRDESTAAVLAQELREFTLKWRLFNGPGVVAAAILAGLGHPLIGFVVMCAAFLVPVLTPVKRWLEYHGHEVEVQAAVLLYGADESEYRAAEAAGMKRGYGGIFKDRLVYCEMLQRRPGARRFVQNRLAMLRRYQQEHR